MDDATLLNMLEQALAAGQMSRRDTPFVRECLPTLRDGTLDPDDRAELLKLLHELDVPAASTTSDSNVASRNTVEGDLTQTTQSGGVNFGSARIGSIGRITGGDEVHGDKKMNDE